MSDFLLILSTAAVLFSCTFVRRDDYKSACVCLVACLFLAVLSEAYRGKELNAEMHQCLKDGGQWVQYSRSGFECVRAER